MKKAALLLLVLAPLLLAACGDSDDDTSTAPAESTTEAGTEAEGGGEEAAGGEAASGGGGGTVVRIDAAEGTELAYVQKDVTAKEGPVTIEFNNPQTLSHDVEVEDPSGEDVGKTDLIADDTTSASLGNLKAGKYTFYCTVPGHQEAGMEGTLTVK
jgi:plastocyanin